MSKFSVFALKPGKGSRKIGKYKTKAKALKAHNRATKKGMVASLFVK